MDFVTVRELRAESAKVWEKLEAGEEIVITRNGKPFALLVHTELSEMEEQLRALRWAHFERLVAEQHKRAVESGLDKMTMEEIDAEIAAVRRERRERNAGGR
ncbi:MAG: type II toxin-antitoxin system prevent-host-death family antitoxin [Betaproteobacteria bacterium]|nr:type II toxin-antitoxin system prevent-host-death family antitoxin [Betaproteobacteria bacterium]